MRTEAFALFVCVLLCTGSPVLAWDQGGGSSELVVEKLSAMDSRIHLSGYVSLVQDNVEGSVRFDRGLDVAQRGLRWSSPGTRIQWITDSSECRVLLRFTDDLAGGARNSVGIYRIDGVWHSGWVFDRDSLTGPGEGGWVLIRAPEEGAFHHYEVILPYGDSVEFGGIWVQSEAEFRSLDSPSRTKYLAFGDSVTQGFTASSVMTTYAFLLAEAMDWELINLGIAGRGTVAADSRAISAVGADVITVLIGVNDWQGGVDPRLFEARYAELVRGILAKASASEIWLITPLWVPESWNPQSARHPLSDYRDAIRNVYAGAGDVRLRIIEGPELIDTDPDLFDRVAVHPNDAGFKQMAARLKTVMNQTQK